MPPPASDGPLSLPMTPLSPAAPRSPLMPLSPSFLARGIRHSTRRGSNRSTILVIVATLGLVALTLRLLPTLPLEGGLLAGSAFGESFAAGFGDLSAKPAVDERDRAHPVLGLVQDAEKRWLTRHGRQSQTLEQAVAEYNRRYRRPPPAGFDDWFLWARASNVTFVDEFDRLERSIEVFGGLDLVDLRRGLADFELENPVVDESTRIFQIRVENGRCVGRGQSNWVKGIGTGRRSGWEFCEALKDVLHLIPDTPDFLYSTHDLGHITMFQTEQDRLRDAFKAGQRKPTRSASDTAMNATMLAHSRMTGYLAVALSCPTGSPARQFREDLMTGKLVWDDSSAGYALSNQLGGLVYNASIAQDACYNAELRKVAGLFLQWSGANSIITQEGSPKAEMLPYFSQSKLSSQVDWLIPQLYAYPTLNDKLSDDYTSPPWDRKQARMVWRGKATGVAYTAIRSAAIGRNRLRLHKQCNDGAGFESYIYASSSETDSKVLHGSALRRDLPDWYDCGLTGPHDCGYDNCEAIKRLFEGANAPYQWKPNESHYERYKFIADVDGFGWSGRFRELLMTGSVVFKATAFPEFFSDALEPWYHYVPSNLDASDLPSLMAFFAGAPSTGAGAHDNLARTIGERGREFVDRHWRREDIQAWIWRVLLEYRRVYAEEPGSMDYVA